MTEPIRDYIITAHAAFEMKRRGIDEVVLRRVLARPDERHPVRLGRDVLQSRIEIKGKTYLVRIFVDVDRNPCEVVTAYLTSKIEKYWRAQP